MKIKINPSVSSTQPISVAQCASCGRVPTTSKKQEMRLTAVPDFRSYWFTLSLSLDTAVAPAPMFKTASFINIAKRWGIPYYFLVFSMTLYFCCFGITQFHIAVTISCIISDLKHRITGVRELSKSPWWVQKSISRKPWSCTLSWIIPWVIGRILILSAFPCWFLEQQSV